MITGDDAAVNKLTAARDVAEETSNTAAKKKKFFNRFSTSQKVLIGSVVLISIVVIIIILASTAAYGVLYSNLSTRDSGLIIEKLKERKVPYRLSADGSVIKVPDDRAAELRMELAAAGLPLGAKTSPSTGDSIQNIDYIRSMDYQRKIEQSLAKKIIALLEPHVGAGKVRADVKLKMNFDKMETTEEKVDPESLAKVSEKSETSSTAPSKSKSEKSQVNYEVSKKTTHLTKPMGEIQRISAAVVIDDALVDVREQGGELIKKSRKRTPEELEAIKKITQAALGFDSQRGDVIEVVNLPFDTSAEKVSKIYQEIYKPTTVDRIGKFFSTPLGIVMIIFLILLIIFLLRKRLIRGVTEIIREIRLPKPGEVEPPRLDDEKLFAVREAKDEAEIERELREKYKVTRSTKKMAIIRDKVKRFASENKDETANLVKSFLYED